MLLRCQIDNILRLSAAWLVGDHREYITKMIEGVPVNQLKDREGHRLTDAFLCKSLAKKYPWIQDVYTHTCGYVHLSEKHMFQTHRAQTGGKMETIIGESDKYVTNELRIEAINAFTASTRLLFDYVADWIQAKTDPADPEVLEERKRIMSEYPGRESGWNTEIRSHHEG